MIAEKLFEFYTSHKGGLNGALVGFLIAAAILIFGFWRVLFIAIFAGLGYYIGKRMYEDRDYLKNLLDRVLPPGTYR